MPVEISRGSRAHCLQGLQSDHFDLSGYPLRSYSDARTFQIGDDEVPVFQGVNTTPRRRFAVSLGTRAALHADLNVPGIVPFLGSSSQVSARRRRAQPAPMDVGLPLLTTETDYLIRWMFGRDGDSHAGHTLWRRLSEEQLHSLHADVRPDESVDSNARTVLSYGRVPGSVSAPEPEEFVRARASGLPHEPWLARSVELAESWRLVVPNTSISCRPAVVPPHLTIIADNYNILLCPSGELAVALGVVLSRPTPQDYLIGISPWAQGGTPRPRSKHVKVTLWSFSDQADEILQAEMPTLRALADSLCEVWQYHLATAISLARGASAVGIPLRDRYRAIAPRDALETVPLSLRSLVQSTLALDTDDQVVRLEFGTPEEAALAAVASWSAIPRQLPINEILGLRFPEDSHPSPDAISRVLFDRLWANLIGETTSDPDTQS